MLFTDPSTSKIYCLTDDEQWHIIAWADNGLVPRIRIAQVKEINQLFYRQPSSCSRVVYNLQTHHAWLRQDSLGLSSQDLIQYIESINWKQEEECLIVYKRRMCPIKRILLPTTVALNEYHMLDGYGVSKVMVNVETHEMLGSQGPEVEECIKYLQRLLL